MEGVAEREYATHSCLSRGAIQKAYKSRRLMFCGNSPLNVVASARLTRSVVCHVPSMKCWVRVALIWVRVGSGYRVRYNPLKLLGGSGWVRVVRVFSLPLYRGSACSPS